MPAQQRPRSNQTRPAGRAWQLAGRRGEQRTISGPKLRPRDLATQDLELVAQDQQLAVLDVQATGTPNQCACIFDGEHSLLIEPREGGRSRFVQSERFSGFLVGFVKGTLAKTEGGFEQMNAALKARVEPPSAQN